LKRTISIMTGKGSVKHNSRAFHAENTDPERAKFNICYANEDIKEVYCNIFGDAVKRHNEKQTRSDRCISDYYEKIRTGKQEKLFHEIIIQIGDMNNMSAISDNGKLAQKILHEYMQSFRNRNPNLYVFSAYLHMDEATPHLHIDFIPFTTNSGRGLDTRVSMKKALENQGFKGGTRSENERNQWVYSEKEALSKIMLNFDVEWEQKGTKEKHLSLLEFEKKKRSEEVDQLEKEIEMIQNTLNKKEAMINSIKVNISKETQELKSIKAKKVKIESINNIEAKPAILSNTKVVINKKDFEDVKTIALKYIAFDEDKQNLARQIKAVSQENQKLKGELYQYKSVKNRLTISGLEAEKSNLQTQINKITRFIESMGLKPQLENFLNQKIGQIR